jgi:hypothetical protein
MDCCACVWPRVTGLSCDPSCLVDGRIGRLFGSTGGADRVWRKGCHRSSNGSLCSWKDWPSSRPLSFANLTGGSGLVASLCSQGLRLKALISAANEERDDGIINRGGSMY